MDRTVGAETPVRPDAGDAFLSWVDDAPVADGRRAREWGDLLVVADGEAYELRHRADRGRPRADLVDRDPATFRGFVRSDDDGRYRPFAGERSLPTGWVMPGLDDPILLRAVASAYPAGIEEWADDADPVPYREVAARQTGIYERVANLSRAELTDVTAAVCGNCAKRRTWDETADDTLPVDRGAGDLPCREPCSFLVAAAREVLVDEPPDEQPPEQPAADVPPGDLTDPANRYRVRYRRAGGNPTTHR
ncbi:DR2241 family protein [Haloplanus sp. HW8-1]|uniref:DR2241 family protein n=1 Tax=Haloplanus pelagicus TaxID=2949995 RepID=UPI00203DD70E|nr:DR2241 family protein [Haloplanus sp. HW8-1]